MTPREDPPVVCEACGQEVTPLCGQLGIPRRFCAEHLTIHLEREHRARVDAGLVPMSDELDTAARRLEDFARSLRGVADSSTADRASTPRSPGP